MQTKAQFLTMPFEPTYTKNKDTALLQRTSKTHLNCSC